MAPRRQAPLRTHPRGWNEMNEAGAQVGSVAPAQRSYRSTHKVAHFRDYKWALTQREQSSSGSSSKEGLEGQRAMRFRPVSR